MRRLTLSRGAGLPTAHRHYIAPLSAEIWPLKYSSALPVIEQICEFYERQNLHLAIEELTGDPKCKSELISRSEGRDVIDVNEAMAAAVEPARC